MVMATLRITMETRMVLPRQRFLAGKLSIYPKPTASNTIVCFNEKPEEFSFNAEFVARSLREKYGLEAPNK